MKADIVELWHQGKQVARHERSYSRQQQILDLEHYLDVLRKKPGALAGIDAARAVAPGRALARVLRSIVASTDLVSWPQAPALVNELVEAKQQL